MRVIGVVTGASATTPQRLATLLCAAAGGVLLFAGLIVAPSLFDALPGDRAMAGRIAARVFQASYWFAGAVGILVIGACAARRNTIFLPALVLIGLAAFQLFVIAPTLVRHGEGWPFSFAALHGIAAGVHVVMTIAAFILAWTLCEIRVKYQ